MGRCSCRSGFRRVRIDAPDNPDGEGLVEHAFDADHGLEESKPDVDGLTSIWTLTCPSSLMRGRVMCSEASGGGVKIGVELGLGDVEAELCLDTVGEARASPAVDFRGCIQGQVGQSWK